MLYLAGQILAYVLVAMVIGAALAWVFLIAPLRRQVREAKAGRQAEPSADQPSHNVPSHNLPSLEQPSHKRPSAGLSPAAAPFASLPAIVDPNTAGQESQAEPVSLPGWTAPLALTAAGEAGPDLSDDEDAATTGPAGHGDAHDIGGPIAVGENSSADAHVTGVAGTGQQSADDVETVEGADSAAADEEEEVAGGAWPGAELATTGPIRLPVGAGQPGGPVSELVELLRDQRDDAALEKADLTARLAVAEQRAAEAEQRTSSAERHAATASARVEEIESALRSRVEASDAAAAQPTAGGPSVVELERESEELRDQLADAEGRAAKFSSRLAMARTEAEDAQRQVATMGTRLDRHQAEWAAERLSLLNRIAKFENALGRGTAPASADDPMDIDDETTVVEDNLPLDARSAAAIDYVQLVGSAKALATARAYLAKPVESAQAATEPAGTPAEPAAEAPQAAPEALQPAVSESAVPVTAVSESAVSESAGLESADDLPAEAAVYSGEVPSQAVGGVDEPGGSDLAATWPRLPAGGTKVRPSAVAGAQARPGPAVGAPVGATGEQAGGGRLVMESAPRWNGLLDPAGAAGGDNLKEIVGVGPVIETRLRGLGITTFSQLAEMGDTDVERLTRMLDGFGDRVISDDWVGQAQDLQVRHYGGVY